ncbi:MAG: hypothetical protein GSR74_03715 [Desulfurococcales archaeon]|nr:hypothetical protein [Desulfurococcales archaeon]
MHVTIPLILILVVGVIFALVLGFLIDRLAIGLARYLLDLVSLEEEFEGENEPSESPIEAFLVKSLVRAMAMETIPDIDDVIVLIGGEASDVTDLLDPELLDTIIEDVFPDYPDSWYNNLTISIINNKLLIILDNHTAKILDRILKSGGEEQAKISNFEELKILYYLIKKIYLAKYPEASDAMAAYVAYKIILKTIKNNILILPAELLEKLPIEPDNIRSKVLAQIRDELNSQY